MIANFSNELLATTARASDTNQSTLRPKRPGSVIFASILIPPTFPHIRQSRRRLPDDNDADNCIGCAGCAALIVAGVECQPQSPNPATNYGGGR